MGNRSEAIALYNKAVEINQTMERSGPNLTLAYQQITSACFTDPSWWECWYTKGNADMDQKWNAAAIGAYYRALEGDCNAQQKAKILTNLAWNLKDMPGRARDAYAAAKDATELDPALPEAWIAVSCTAGTLKRQEISLKAALKAKELKDNSNARMQLSFAYLFDRQWAKGLTEFECRFAYRLHHFLHYPYPEWQGEPDKSVFLVYDQGLGDTLSYARFVELTCQRARYVHMCIQPELYRWFIQAFGHIRNLNIVPGAVQFPGDVDYWTTFVSLPFALQLTDKEIEDIPNIKPPQPPPLPNWRVPDAKFHIGIAWGGSPMNDIDRHRSIPLPHFFELYQVNGIQLYSLQVDERRHDMNTTGSSALVKDMSLYIRDVADTVGILQHLDLVISLESAMGHICSMVDKECWISYSYVGRDYRIGPPHEKRLWTPHHRIFQQDENCRWEAVFDQIIKTLRKKVRSKGE